MAGVGSGGGTYGSDERDAAPLAVSAGAEHVDWISGKGRGAGLTEVGPWWRGMPPGREEGAGFQIPAGGGAQSSGAEEGRGKQGRRGR